MTTKSTLPLAADFFRSIAMMALECAEQLEGVRDMPAEFDDLDKAGLVSDAIENIKWDLASLEKMTDAESRT